MFTLIAESYQDQVLYRRDPETGEEEGRFGDAPGLEVWADTSEVPALAENLQEKADLWTGLADAGFVKREWAAKTHFDIPDEAIPEEEPEGEGEEEAEDFDPDADPDVDSDVDSDVDPDDPDADADGPAAAPPPATKARGGSRPKGKGDISRTPPNVSRAARRVARGEGTSDDQKLLKAWGRSKEGRSRQPLEAYVERATARELATHREKLRSIESDWQAKLARHEATTARKRSALESRVEGKPDAQSRLAEFDRKAAEGRPGREDHEAFVYGRTLDAYDVARHAHVEGASNRSSLRNAAYADERGHPAARRFAADYVAKNLPPSLRDDPDPVRFLPVGDPAREIYRERGGAWADGEEVVGGFRRPTSSPDNPALFAAAESEARSLWLDALARHAGRGTKALGGPTNAEGE